MLIEPLRPYLMTVSGLLLLFGLWQLYRGGRTCERRSRASVAIFWASAVIVIVMMAAPQLLASLLADL